MFKFDEYCIKGEVWKSIPEYEGLYEASNLGRVRSVEGKITYNQYGGERKWRGRILKNKTKEMRPEGYKVTLYKDKVKKDWLVARLICSTFHGVVDHDLPVKIKMTVNHKDGNRKNNNVDNLEWLSLQDNIKHAYENGLYDNCKKQVIIDLENGFSKRFDTLKEASIYIGMNRGYLSNCIKKNREAKWKDGTKVNFILVGEL